MILLKTGTTNQSEEEIHKVKELTCSLSDIEKRQQR